LEPIKQALIKAKVTPGKEAGQFHPTPQPRAMTGPAWTPKRVQLDSTHLEQQRIVSFSMKDPSYIAFNLLRTKVSRVLKEKGWTSMAITSPTPGCGKTMVAVNLALSLARHADYKTVLVDLDLRKPTVGRSLGITPDSSMGQYLDGKAELERCFVQVSDNLTVGCNNSPVSNPSERIHHLNEMLKEVRDSLKPNLMLFDLPPILSGDEAITFLPHADCCLLVIGSGLTTPSEVDECVRQANVTNYLGVVLNKCTETSHGQYHYG
jgi:protein-tyrosine kinase